MPCHEIPSITIDLIHAFSYNTKYAGVAKLVIALACHAGDHGFEPRHSRKSLSKGKGIFFLISTGNSAAGSALGSGPRGRGFKSRLPDSFLKI